MSKAAPAPYSTLDIGSERGFHTYIIDANGRKIGVVWGPVAEKVWTAALLAAAPDLLDVAKAFVLWADGTEAVDVVPLSDVEDARAAIAKAEGGT